MNINSQKESTTKKSHLNPFMQFCLEQNAKSAKDGIKETLHTLGEKWNQLPLESKEEYITKSKK